MESCFWDVGRMGFSARLYIKEKKYKNQTNLKLCFLKEIKRHEKMKGIDGERKGCNGGEVCLFPYAWHQIDIEFKQGRKKSFERN